MISRCDSHKQIIGDNNRWQANLTVFVTDIQNDKKNASKMHQKIDNLWFNEHEYYMKINERRQQKSKLLSEIAGDLVNT